MLLRTREPVIQPTDVTLTQHNQMKTLHNTYLYQEDSQIFSEYYSSTHQTFIHW